MKWISVCTGIEGAQNFIGVF